MVLLPFQSLSGLTLGLNAHADVDEFLRHDVSIPFRADTGFEPEILRTHDPRMKVSIPFRADTGFEHPASSAIANETVFQSLSGLTLGLNGR